MIVDDKKDCCDDLADFLSSLSYETVKIYSAKDALSLCRESHFDIVISDVGMPMISGIELSQELQTLPNPPAIILMSGREDIIDSIHALELGIFDFLSKPIDLKQLVEIIKKIELQLKKITQSSKKSVFDFRRLEKNTPICINEYNPDEDFSFAHPQIGEIGIFSKRTHILYNKLDKLSEYTDIPILIEGPTGSGKEVVARYLHYKNTRLEGQFVAINCSNLGKELFEAELFGYEKGSFTGADSKGRDGKIKLSEKGTLFLDEISEIPLDLQSKLLRVIQEREYYKIGGNQKLKANTRFVCATNQNLKESVKKGGFREDLYYRLSVCPVNLPSLSERKEEVIPLFFAFLKQAIELLKKPITHIEAQVIQSASEYSWPGNIREMKNAITKAVLFSETSLAKKEDFNFSIFSASKTFSMDLNQVELPENPFNLEELNQIIVKKALEKFKGNKTKTAEFLGLTRIQLYKRFKVDQDS